MKKIFFVFIVITLSQFLLFPQSAREDFELISRWAGGPCLSIEVNDSLIFMSNGGYVDIYNQIDLKRYSRIEVNSYITELVEKDSLLFVSTDSDGLYIFNIREITNPIEVSKILISGRIETFKLRNKYIYCATSIGLLSIDISDISSPTINYSYYNYNSILDLDFYKNYLYITNYACGSGSGFIIFDISNQVSPVVVNNFNIGFLAGCRSLSISDDRLYVTCFCSSNYPGGTVCLSLNDPVNPNFTAFIYDTGYKIYAQNEIAYLIGTDDNVSIFNISKPDSIEYLNTIQTNGSSKRLKVLDNKIYVASSNNGLQIYDLANISNPILIEHLITPGTTEYLAIDSSYAYISSSGLWILDITDIHHPKEVGSYNLMLSSTKQITKKDSLIFLLDEQFGIRIFSIKDVEKPIILSSINCGIVGNFTFKDSILIIGCNDRIELWNVKIPNYPIKMDEIIIQGFCNDLTVKDKYLFASCAFENLLIYDITNLYNPTLLKSVPISLTSLKIVDNFLIGHHGFDFLVYNVSDLLNISMQYYNNFGDYIYNVSVDHNISYIFHNDAGIRAINLLDSTIVSTYNEGKSSWSGCFNTQYLFVASIYGISIFKKPFITSVTQYDKLIDHFALSQNYPNPFNPNTSIQYAISNTQFVTLKVYDLLGREVATLVNEEKTAGTYNVVFRMQNPPTGQAGLELSSGIYFYQLRAGDPSSGSGQSFVETKKMILLK